MSVDIVRTEYGPLHGGDYNDEICERCDQRRGKHAVPIVTHYGNPPPWELYCLHSETLFSGSGKYVRVKADDLL